MVIRRYCGSIQEQQYLDEDHLPLLKTIFWKNQIVAFAPYLYGSTQSNSNEIVIITGTWFDKQIVIPGSSVTLPNRTVIKRDAGMFSTGVKSIASWWKIDGKWPNDNDVDQSLVGVSVARRLNLKVNDVYELISHDGHTYKFFVSGIVSTGSFEDDQIFVTLDSAQSILGKSGYVQKILVSALIKPDDDLARKDHTQMTAAEHERWYCSPYIDVFAYQIKEVIPGATAKPIRQVAETEGKLMSQNQLLFTLIALSSIITSSIAVAGTMTASILQKKKDIGLMKAIGADDSQISSVFLLEVLVIGILGGLSGFPIGYILSNFISSSVFGSQTTTFDPMVLPITLLIAIGISLLGGLIPIRKATALQPIGLLKGQ